MTQKAEDTSTSLSRDELKGIVSQLSSEDFLLAFRSAMPFERGHYYLHAETLASAISDAVTDLNRAASYHSETGPSLPRIAGYVGWWISVARPIQLSKDSRIDKYNDIVARDLLCINAIFSVFCIRKMMGKKIIPVKVYQNLRYALQFRPRFDGEAIAMLLSNTIEEE